MRTPQSRVDFRRSMQMCRQRRVRTMTKKGGDNFFWSMYRVGGMSTQLNGDNFRRSLQRVGRMIMVVFLSPLHSPWSRKSFRTWLSNTVVTMKMKMVMGMIQMVPWGDLVHSYVTYDWFIEIWGFKKEEILNHYKFLEKKFIGMAWRKKSLPRYMWSWWNKTNR